MSLCLCRAQAMHSVKSTSFTEFETELSITKGIDLLAFHACYVCTYNCKAKSILLHVDGYINFIPFLPT